MRNDLVQDEGVFLVCLALQHVSKENPAPRFPEDNIFSLCSSVSLAARIDWTLKIELPLLPEAFSSLSSEAGALALHSQEAEHTSIKVPSNLAQVPTSPSEL